MEAGQVLLFTGGVSCRSAAVCRRCGLPLRLCRGDLPRRVPSVMQFCCGACLRFTPAVCLLTNRTACGMLRFYSAGSRSPFVRSRGVGAVIGRGGNAELVCAAMRFLSPRLAFGLRLSSRLYCGVLSSVHACLFSFVRKKETACDALRFYSAGRDRHSCVLVMLARLSAFVGSLRVCAFLCGDLDGIAGDAGNRATKERGWRRGACALLRNRIGFEMLSAGSTLGAARPQTCAKESSTLWTLFTLRRGCVGADSRRLCAFRGENVGAKCGSRPAGHSAYFFAAFAIVMARTFVGRPKRLMKPFASY